MRKSKSFLLKRDIADLAEALEILINEQLSTLHGLGKMVPNLTDPVLINKAYKEMGGIVQSLLPVQYLVEHHHPAMKEVFEQFNQKKMAETSKTKEM